MRLEVGFTGLSAGGRDRLLARLNDWAEDEARLNTRGEDALLSGQLAVDDSLLCLGSGIAAFLDDGPTSGDANTTNTDDLVLPQLEVTPTRREFNAAASFEAGVPLYNRVEGSGRKAPRCYNCGSYAHNLEDCRKEKNSTAIAAARAAAPRSLPNLESADKARAEYAGLKQGVLSPALREALGIGHDDLPPWTARMQALGPLPRAIPRVPVPHGLTFYEGSPGDDPPPKRARVDLSLPVKDEPM